MMIDDQQSSQRPAHYDQNTIWITDVFYVPIISFQYQKVVPQWHTPSQGHTDQAWHLMLY